MKESKFQTQIKRSFDLYCSNNNLIGHYHKIIDCGYTNPYDCFFLTKNGFVACELKVNRQKTTFNFKALFGYGKQYHEITNLKRVMATGSRAWVVIAHVQSNGRYKAYYMSPDKADEYYNSNKGIKFERLEEECFELPRIKNEFSNELIYDLTLIL